MSFVEGIDVGDDNALPSKREVSFIAINDIPVPNNAFFLIFHHC